MGSAHVHSTPAEFPAPQGSKDRWGFSFLHPAGISLLSFWRRGGLCHHFPGGTLGMSFNPSHPLLLAQGGGWSRSGHRCWALWCWGVSHREQGQGTGPSRDPKALWGGQLLSKGCVQLRRFWPPAQLAQPEVEEELNLKTYGGALGRAGWRRASLQLPVQEAWGTGMFLAIAPSFSLGSYRPGREKCPFHQRETTPGAELKRCRAPQ